VARSVLVRWADITAVVDDDEMLDDAARERCARFRALADRQRFVGARMLLRQAVAERTGCDEADVTLVQRCARCGGPHGAPSVLARGGVGPSVSIAHAGDLAIVAVADAAVGVDVEPDRTDLDVHGWVRTEAMLKATGTGFDVDRVVSRLPRMRLAELATRGDHLAAVARLGRRPLHVDIAEVELALTT